MRILIIDPDPCVRDSIKAILESQFFVVDSCPDGKSGFQLALMNEYDCIILDTHITILTSEAFCTQFRSRGKHVPILILSSTMDIPIRVHFLNLGADDFLTKPFASKELIARIKALLRRPLKLVRDIYTIDNLKLDVQRCRVTRGGKHIYLTRKEFTLLQYLLIHQGFVLSRAKLMEHVWDRYIDPFSNTIETHILNLRKKIDLKRSKKLIHTIPGRGYKLDIRP